MSGPAEVRHVVSYRDGCLYCRGNPGDSHPIGCPGITREFLLDFHGISRSVLEARIRTLVQLLGVIDPLLDSAERELVDRAVRVQLAREQC